jgi:hypothetical protein
MKHEPQGEDEIELIIGDIITLLQNLRNGSSLGRNHRTNTTGNYPEYKTQEKPTIIKYI